VLLLWRNAVVAGAVECGINAVVSREYCSGLQRWTVVSHVLQLWRNAVVAGVVECGINAVVSRRLRIEVRSCRPGVKKFSCYQCSGERNKRCSRSVH
jgi:hypothetical protein